MVGGIAAMMPQLRAEIASLGAKTMVSGTLATLMTGAVVGVMTAGREIHREETIDGQ